MNPEFALVCKTCGGKLNFASFYRGATMCLECIAKAAVATFHKDGLYMVTTPLIVLPFGNDPVITGVLDYLDEQRKLLEQKGFGPNWIQYTHGFQPVYTLSGGNNLDGRLEACGDETTLRLNNADVEVVFLLNNEGIHFTHVYGRFQLICALFGVFSALMSVDRYGTWQAVDQRYKDM